MQYLQPALDALLGFPVRSLFISKLEINKIRNYLKSVAIYAIK
jgi:hypothetical protein